MGTIKPNYYYCGNKNILVLFPPGLGESKHYDYLINSQNDKYGMITFDLPGVNPEWCDTKVKDIAYEISKILNELKNKNLILIGDSYGGVLLIEALRSYKGISTNVLLGSGEFFDPFTTTILKSLFWLPSKSSLVKRIYAKALHMIGLFKIGKYTDKQLEVINRRWLEILDYKLPTNYKCLNRTYLVKGSGDIILNPGSKEKLRKIFPNFVLIKSVNGHFDYKQWLEKQW
jgi:hypothetical protein